VLEIFSNQNIRFCFLIKGKQKIEIYKNIMESATGTRFCLRELLMSFFLFLENICNQGILQATFSEPMVVPTIDLDQRSPVDQIIAEINSACSSIGFMQIVSSNTCATSYDASLLNIVYIGR
jgi:hypothetical protein